MVRLVKCYKKANLIQREYKIQVKNVELKERIIEVLSNVNWKEEFKLYAPILRIKQYHIIEVLKKYIPKIK
jgi:hypothetical protein